MSDTTAANPPIAKVPARWGRPLTEVNATIRKAEKGDKAALAEVRCWLSTPGAADVLSGNLAQEALQILIGKCTSNPVIREALTRKLDEMRAELSGPTPTPLEKLLVERVVATWLHLHHLESEFASKASYPLELGVYYQKAISAAQKRYLTAIKGLSDVRKLALPVLQVNIAKKQVNIAAGTVATTPTSLD